MTDKKKRKKCNCIVGYDDYYEGFVYLSETVANYRKKEIDFFSYCPKCGKKLRRK